MIRSIFIFSFTLLFVSTIFSQQIVPYRKKNKWGYANSKGEVVIKPQYRVAYPFTANITAVKKDDKYGFIDKSGSPITKFEFIRVSEFYNGQSSVWTKKTSYCIDKNGGKTQCLAFCGTVNSPLEHFQTYTKNGKLGLINYAYFTDSPNR
ncbi:MAG: WG repeat-containing protein, partial [Vicingaceae bacterium]